MSSSSLYGGRLGLETGSCDGRTESLPLAAISASLISFSLSACLSSLSGCFSSFLISLSFLSLFLSLSLSFFPFVFLLFYDPLANFFALQTDGFTLLLQFLKGRHEEDQTENTTQNKKLDNTSRAKSGKSKSLTAIKTLS